MPKSPAVVDALESRTLYAATLTAGETSVKGISSTFRQRNYQFQFTAGQYVAFAAGDLGTTAFSPKLRLFNSANKAVRTSVGDDGAFLSFTVNKTGTYTLRLQDVDGTHTGSANLTAFFASRTQSPADADDGGLLVSGRRFAAGISAGDLDVWRFDGTAGAFLQIVANENDNNSDVGVGVALIDPDGVGVTSAQDEKGFALDQKLEKTGTYYAVVYEPGANNSGRYGISIGLVPGEQTDEDPDTQAPLVVNTPRTGDMPSGDTDVFTVPLGKRVTASFTLARTTDTATPEMQLVDATGNVVAEASGDRTATLTYTTPAVRGTYYLVTRNKTPDTGGQYRLTLTAK